jgi:hypothetical protein
MQVIAHTSCQDNRTCTLLGASLLLFLAALVSPARAVNLPTQTNGVGTFGVAYGYQVSRAAQIAQTYSVVTCTDSINVRPMKQADSSTPILGYIDTNLAYYNAWFAEAQKYEDAFLHSSDPAGLTAHWVSGGINLAWFADRRVADGTVSLRGYNLYRRRGTSGPFTLLTPSPITATSYQDTGLLNGTQYQYKVGTVDLTRGELTYSEEILASPGVTALPFLAPVSVTVAPAGSTANVTFTVAGAPAISAVDLWIDSDRSRTFDAGESFPMSRSGTDGLGNGIYSLTRSLQVNYSVGCPVGYGWYASAGLGSDLVRLPASGAFTTNTNNRVRNTTWGVWAMDPADTTWQRILSNGVRTLRATGYDGIFLDDCYSLPFELELDAETPRSVTVRWRSSMQSLISALRSAALPGSLLFNGLSDATIGYVDASDGGMLEGFIVAPWKTNGANTGWWWANALNAGLRAQGGRAATQLYLSLGEPDAVQMRFFALASYLLIKDTRAFFAYARDNVYDDPMYFPEFDLDIGAPVQSFSSIEQARRPSGLYGRLFDRALILVNGSDADTLSETLSGSYALVTATGDEVPSFGGNGALSARWVNSVRLGPRESAILMTQWNGSINQPAQSPGAEGPSPDKLARPLTLTVSPNPSSGPIRVDLSLPVDGEVRVSLYDAAGRRVREYLQENASEGTMSRNIDLADLPSRRGVFTVVAETRGGRVAQPIIVTRAATGR